MKTRSSLFAVAMLTAIQPVHAATTDPLRTVYRIAGVADNGAVTHSGIATSFHCTSFSRVNETIRFVIRNASGTVVGDVSPTITGNDTVTVSTHLTNVFVDAAAASFDIIAQGSAIIQSTTLNITCSAMIVDAATTVPQGIALHMQRFNPLPDTQE